MANKTGLKGQIRNAQPIEKCNCYVCNFGYRNQEHHIIKVIDIYNICVKNNFKRVKELYVPEVPLCDYHHKLEHILCGDVKNDRIKITELEIEKMEDILTEVNTLVGILPEDIEIDYWSAYDDMCVRFEDGVEAHMNKELTKECEIKHYFDNDMPLPKSLQFTEADFIKGDVYIEELA